MRGNVIAIMAAALVPMIGFAGSAVDMARLYMVKSRLQQACDAGTLAGRKAMTDTTLTTTTLDTTAKAQANSFFYNNFPTGMYQSTNLTFTPIKAAVGGATSANAVSATASAKVPMAVMKFFGITAQTVAIACQARYDVADTDILFVLDTTGSMACLPADSDSTCSSYAGSATKVAFSRPSASNGVTGYAGATGYGVTEKSNSRIEALRTAVLSFYDTFAANADSSTHVRYGFVTYSSSVNVGKAILDVVPSGLVGSISGDTASYQSRQVTADYEISVSSKSNGKSKSSCNAFVETRSPTTALTYDSSTGTATRVTNVWSDSTCYTRTATVGPKYQYSKIAWPVSAVVGGSIVTNPTKVRGQTMRWLGCVETTVDTPGQSTFTTTALPSELNPDYVPTNTSSGDKRWIPHMQDLEYIRNGSFTDSSTDTTNGDSWGIAPGYGSDAYAVNASGTSADGDTYQKAGAVACGKPVKRLGTMTRAEVKSYVYATDFVPIGGTYHDVGMIWGARLISPTGPWAADTATWTGRNAPNRVIIFLTDGDMAPTVSSYSMYGMEGYDGRVTNGSTSNITTLHNARFLAACAAAKARNIDVWTVSIDSSASTQMQTCATTTAQALYTTDGSGLATAFAAIAKKLAMLRISL